MWNVALEKKKIVSVFMLTILKKNLMKGFARAETINTEDTATSVEI